MPYVDEQGSFERSADEYKKFEVTLGKDCNHYTELLDDLNIRLYAKHLFGLRKTWYTVTSQKPTGTADFGLSYEFVVTINGQQQKERLLIKLKKGTKTNLTIDAVYEQGELAKWMLALLLDADEIKNKIAEYEGKKHFSKEYKDWTGVYKYKTLKQKVPHHTTTRN